MSEPTIDEMLEWNARVIRFSGDCKPVFIAIQTILEEYRLTHSQGYAMVPYATIEQTKLEAIRAFVERVSQRYQQKRAPLLQAMLEELAAMEKETQTQ